MSDPLIPPAAAGRPATDGSAGHSRLVGGGQLQPTSAVVLALTRHGPLIESGGRRWLVSGAPPLPQGATLTLAQPAAGGGPHPARLLAIGARVLAQPVTLQLQPATTRPSAPPPGGSAPQTPPVLQLEARLIGPAGRALGAPLSVGLALAAGPAVPDAALPAEVVRRDALGRPVLAAGDRMLRLEAPLDLPPGARLLLTLPPGTAPATPDGAPDEDPLQRAIALLLQRQSGGGADDGGRLRLPAPDHPLAARLLRWVRALGADEEQADEPAALRSALGELARAAREPQAGGWRVLVMPFGGEDPQPLKLCLRQPAPDPDDGRHAGGDADEGPRRAVFALELSHLGPCQLDVLCQQARFDLVVRTTRPLGRAVEDEIRRVVDASRAAAGLGGRLEFHTGDLLALPDPLPAGGHRLTA